MAETPPKSPIGGDGENLKNELQGLTRRTNPHLVFFRTGALGDSILLLPTVRLARRNFPAARITVVASHWMKSLLRLWPDPPGYVSFDSAGLSSLFLRNSTFSAPEWLNTADLVVIYSSRENTPLIDNLRQTSPGAVMTARTDPPSGMHAARHFASAITGRVPRVEELPLPNLRAFGEHRQSAKNWLNAHGIDADQSFAVIHPGSGSPRKCWPSENFAAIVNRLTVRGLPVVLLEGPADASSVADTLTALPGPLQPPIARGRELGTVAGLLRRCALYLGNDSGISHLAAAVGAPSVVVFGRTDPGIWHPIGERVQVAGRKNRWPTRERVLGLVEDLM